MQTLIRGHIQEPSDLGLHCVWKIHQCAINRSSVLKELTYVMSSGENPAYGANAVFLDYPFAYLNIHRSFKNWAESKKSVFCRCSYVTKSPGSDQTPHRTLGVWSEPWPFCPSISWVFADEVKYFCSLHLPRIRPSSVRTQTPKGTRITWSSPSGARITRFLKTVYKQWNPAKPSDRNIDKYSTAYKKIEKRKRNRNTTATHCLKVFCN